MGECCYDEQRSGEVDQAMLRNFADSAFESACKI